MSNPTSKERNELLEKAVNFLRSFGGAHHPEAMAIDELRVALSQLEVRYERMRSHWEEACKQIGRPASETEEPRQLGWARVFPNGVFDVFHDQPRKAERGETWTVVPLFAGAAVKTSTCARCGGAKIIRDPETWQGGPCPECSPEWHSSEKTNDEVQP